MMMHKILPTHFRGHIRNPHVEMYYNIGYNLIK